MDEKKFILQSLLLGGVIFILTAVLAIRFFRVL